MKKKKGNKIVFAFKKTVLFSLYRSMKNIIAKYEFWRRLRLLKEVYDYQVWYISISFYNIPATSLLFLAGFRTLWQSFLHAPVKRKSSEVKPVKYIYIYIEKYMSLFLFLLSYASEDFLILPFIVIYMHITNECVDAFMCALLRENGSTYSYRISYENSKTPECMHLGFEFSNFFSEF